MLITKGMNRRPKQEQPSEQLIAGGVFLERIARVMAGTVAMIFAWCKNIQKIFCMGNVLSIRFRPAKSLSTY
jgi:hypothetical protein